MPRSGDVASALAVATPEQRRAYVDMRLSGPPFGYGVTQNPPEGFDLEQLYDELLQRGGGTSTGAMLQSDINRGVVPGTRSPGSEEMSPTQLAELDRFAWGRQAGMGGLPVAAGYEALKAVSQTPGLSRVLPAVASALGFEDTEEQFDANAPTSSPASWSNIGAYIRGAWPNIRAGSAAEALASSALKTPGAIRR
jgi:hypothetical protein